MIPPAGLKSTRVEHVGVDPEEAQHQQQSAEIATSRHPSCESRWRTCMHSFQACMPSPKGVPSAQSCERMTFDIAWVGGEHLALSHTLLARLVRGGRYYFRRASTQRKPSQ
jgi:hypothetical protein